MLQAAFLTLVLAGTCAAQPPSPPTQLDRLKLKGIPAFDGAAERRRLIERDDQVIAMMEDFIQQNEYAIRNFGFLPAQEASMKETQDKVRKLLVEAKRMRQDLLDEEAREAKARPVPTPVAPMPREKRHD